MVSHFDVMRRAVAQCTASYPHNVSRARKTLKTMSIAPLEYLFPVPSLSKSSLSPSHFPGITPESTETLQKTLKDNHVRWHIFFNEKRFHNHAAHRAIAAWALGAEPSTILSGYEKDCGYEKPAIKSPHPITADNFEEHLGDDQYYSAYAQFFSERVREKGIPAVLEEFIFSRKANVGTGANSRQPMMLSRFLSGVLHPFIHTGYGAEFDLPGMVVEGLAMTAVTLCPSEFLRHLALFDEDSDTLRRLAHDASQTIDNALNTTASLVDKVLPSNLQLTSNSNTTVRQSMASMHQMKSHALSILSHVLRDRRFVSSEGAKDAENPFENTINKHGKALAAYVKQWDINEKDIDKKVEELVWTVCVLYGVGGWTDGKAHANSEHKEHNFNADFFLMHLVTSSLFLPALCARLQPASQVRLLKAYLYTVLIWAVARGQPALDVRGLMAELQNPEADFLPDSVKAMRNLDLWMRIIEEARGHHDEHVTKTIRALAAWASAFGLRKARARLGQDGLEKDVDEMQVRDVARNTAESPVLGVSPQDNKDLNPKAWRDAKNESESGEETATGEIDAQASRDVAQALQESLDKDRDSNTLPQTELPGSEFLDGGLFLRVAVLTLGRMGWDKDGVKKKPKWERKEGQREEEEFWDFKGFFDQNKNSTVKDVEEDLKAKY